MRKKFNRGKASINTNAMSADQISQIKKLVWQKGIFEVDYLKSYYDMNLAK